MRVQHARQSVIVCVSAHLAERRLVNNTRAKLRARCCLFVAKFKYKKFILTRCWVVCAPHLHGNGIDAVCVFELQTNVKNLSTRHDFTHNMLFTMSVLTDTHERALTGKQMELDIGKMHLLPQKKL